MPTLRGTAGNETDKAVMFRWTSLVYPNGNEEQCSGQGWFPLSQVTSISRNASKDDEIVISEWIAEKKGLYDELD